ncbi:formylglycine-generating enzyme family protein [Glycomyces paridis]|uniref:Formylglycine-generating enzyme family protein n=2 Tax=Glycomyces paridis TaxID=2126555 RepID=A0A4V4HNS1_9ACTN|nr:formylglycine-generating enzyme family protein [Glycomyces paridis]
MRAIEAGTTALTDRRTGRTWTVDVAPFLLAAVQATRRDIGAADPEGDDLLPATDLSWYDAVHACNRMSQREGLRPAYTVDGDGDGDGQVAWDRTADGYRLPTEAEWEHACRAGTAGPRYGDLDDIAWYRANAGERPHRGARKTPNAWGLHDMLGNVWEWCWDLYDADEYADYRVIRGGGWFDDHWSCRAGVRRKTMPTLRIDDLGFRPARNAPRA